MRQQPYWTALIVTSIAAGIAASIVAGMVAAAGAARAQTGAVRHDAEAVAGGGDRIARGTRWARWGSGLELSASGLAASRRPAVDDAYVIIQDAFGSLIVAPEAGSGHRMTVGFGGIWAARPVPSNRPAVRLDASPDQEVREVLSYYTPRFEGLRLGLSYIPKPEPGAGGATDPDGMALGASFDRRFDRFGVGVTARYAAADTSDDPALPDRDAWTVAARLDFGGLRVSGEFTKNNDPGDDATPTATPVPGDAWNISATHQWDRNDVSLVFEHGENQAVIMAPRDVELDAAMVSYDRTLSRGVKWSVNLYWAESAGAAVRGSDSDEWVALTTGLRLSF